MASDLFITKKGNPENPAVVCLHGLLGASRNLFRLSNKIAEEGFYVISYDQRGHGHSPHLPTGKSYTFSSFAEDLKEVLDSLDIKKAHLVGHSLGARVSLSFAAMYPEYAKTLCMLDAGMTIDSKALSALRQTIEPLPLEFENKASAEQFLLHYDNGMKQFLLSNLKNVDGKMKWVVDLEGLRTSLLIAIQTDQSEFWKKLTIPILILRGQLSEHFTQKELDRMLSLNSNARAILIPGAAHWLHVDNFEATSNAVLTFLKGNKN